jgi:hypothetical protein
MNHKPLLLLLALLSLIVSCKKDADQPPPPVPPVSEPLTVAATKPGDTLYIKGENFSEVAANNTVKINGVAATVVVASTTELKVVVPANATTGSVTVTVNGQSIEVGTLTVVPLTLFVYKRNYADQNNYLRQIFTVDPATDQETLLYTLPDSLSVYLDDMVYLPATNELVGLTGVVGSALFRLNVTTKQASYVVLSRNTNIDFWELVVDKFSNLYVVKRDYSDPNHYMQSLVKLDPKTGTQVPIKTFEYALYWKSLVYLPAENKVTGLAESGEALLSVNLTTKDTSWKALPAQLDKPFYELMVDNQSNLYGFQAIYENSGPGQGQFHKLNPATGQASLLYTFTDYYNVESNLVYLPNRNELVAVWDLNKLFRFNLTTKTNSIVPLTTQTMWLNYGDLAVN